MVREELSVPSRSPDEHHIWGDVCVPCDIAATRAGVLDLLVMVKLLSEISEL